MPEEPHFKGNLYEVIGMAKHSETLEEMVVYRALYGEGGLWVRRASMWNETIERDGISEIYMDQGQRINTRR